MKITFSEEGWNEYLYWQSQDKKTVKRINQLLKSIERDGVLSGLGNPEALKYDMQGFYSRRIDSSNRLVYKILGEQIIVNKCKGHYDS